MHTKWFLIFTYKRLKKKKNKEKLSVYILTGNKKFFFIKHAQEYLQFEMIQCSVHKQKTNIAVVTNTTTILNDNAVFSWQMTDIVEMFFRSDNLLQSAKVLTIVDWVKWWNGRSLISLFTLKCLISPCCKQTKILIDWVLTLDSPAIMTVSAAYIPQASRPFTLTNTPNTLSFHISNHPCPAREAGWRWRAKSNHANKTCGWPTLHWQENYGCRPELEKTATFVNRSEPCGCTCQKKKQWGGSLSEK